MQQRKASNRNIMRIDLAPEVRQRLHELIERVGMTQVSVLSRLIEFVANLPDEVQLTVLRRNIAGSESSTAICKLLAQKTEVRRDRRAQTLSS